MSLSAKVQQTIIATDIKPKYVVGYLSEKSLEKLKNYKYVSSMSSYLDTYIMTPFWNWSLQFIPLWLAPNVITTISLLHAIFMQILLLYYCPTFTETAPSWVYFVCAFCMFLYQTFDALDGKQARRTKSGSPLGQLFDHGCDSICTIIIGITMSETMQLGNDILALYMLVLSIIPFFMSNWEESNTGVMRFGIIGVTEAQFIIILIFITTGIYGPSIWQTGIWDFNLVLIFPLSSESYAWTLTVSNLLLIITSLSVIFQIYTSITQVKTYFTVQSKNLQSQLKSNIMNQGALFIKNAESTYQFLQFSYFLITSCFWFFTSKFVLYIPNSLILWTVGLLFAYQVSWLILSHVTDTDYPSFDFLMYFIFHVINSLINMQFPILSTILTYGFIIMVHCKYFTFIYLSINQITNYLGIYCFSINDKSHKLNQK